MNNYTEVLTQIELKLEELVNTVTTSKYNPFYYHGALPQFYLWVLFLSGLLLFAYYIPVIDNAGAALPGAATALVAAGRRQKYAVPKHSNMTVAPESIQTQSSGGTCIG